MTLMAIGFVLFFGTHLLPATPLRDALKSRLGNKPYQAMFSVLSLTGLVLIVVGYRQIPVEYVFPPMAWGRAAALHTMPFVFILFAAAGMPTHIRKWLKHPMSIGLLIWALLHFFANGERAAVWLFGAFAVYALVSIVSSSIRGQAVANIDKPIAWKYDLMAVGGGILVYGVVLVAHGWVFNRPLLSFG